MLYNILSISLKNTMDGYIKLHIINNENSKVAFIVQDTSQPFEEK